MKSLRRHRRGIAGIIEVLLVAIVLGAAGFVVYRVISSNDSEEEITSSAAIDSTIELTPVETVDEVLAADPIVTANMTVKQIAEVGEADSIAKAGQNIGNRSWTGPLKFEGGTFTLPRYNVDNGYGHFSNMSWINVQFVDYGTIARMVAGTPMGGSGASEYTSFASFVNFMSGFSTLPANPDYVTVCLLGRFAADDARLQIDATMPKAITSSDLSGTQLYKAMNPLSAATEAGPMSGNFTEQCYTLGQSNIDAGGLIIVDQSGTGHSDQPSVMLSAGSESAAPGDVLYEVKSVTLKYGEKAWVVWNRMQVVTTGAMVSNAATAAGKNVTVLEFTNLAANRKNKVIVPAAELSTFLRFSETTGPGTTYKYCALAASTEGRVNLRISGPGLTKEVVINNFGNYGKAGTTATLQNYCATTAPINSTSPSEEIASTLNTPLTIYFSTGDSGHALLRQVIIKAID